MARLSAPSPRRARQRRIFPKQAEMSDHVSRRQFLGTLAAGGAATTVAAAPAPERHPPGWRGDDRVQQIATTCEMCFWRCGVVANVAGGRVLSLEGNPQHPLTRGRLCARGNAGTRLLYDPDRLKYPLLRTGARGEGQFKRIGWDAGARRARGETAGAQDRVRAGERRLLSARPRTQVLQHPDEGVRHAEQRRTVVRAVPRASGSGLHADVRPGAGIARAGRSRSGEDDRAHRQPPGRERLHVADHGIRRGTGGRRQAGRRRPALLDGRVESRLVAAHPARHGPRPAPRVDARPDRREPVRPPVHRASTRAASTNWRRTSASSAPNGPSRSRSCRRRGFARPPARWPRPAPPSSCIRAVTSRGTATTRSARARWRS